MAPVIRRLEADPQIQSRIVATAQHREMLDVVVDRFELRIDRDLDVMNADQQLAQLTARLLRRLDPVLEEEGPDLVLAQGDTSTVVCAALACFYRGIRFGHVEAGLRTHDLAFPFPEELNRVLVGRLATDHFAPTAGARDNLLAEGADPARIEVTGNTVIDAVLGAAAMDVPLDIPLDPGARLILVTAHRREGFGAPMRSALGALRELVDRYRDLQLVYPVHPNPNVRAIVGQVLAGHPRILLCEPLDYFGFVQLMARSYFIVTDSGGIQEEAPALGKPVLVLRAKTERPEAVAEGVVELVGMDPECILASATRLLDDAEAYGTMARGVSPYGDGRAAERIHAAIRRQL